MIYPLRTAVILGATVAALVVGNARLGAEPAVGKRLQDGSTLTLLGTTFGKVHDFAAQNPGVLPDADIVTEQPPVPLPHRAMIERRLGEAPETLALWWRITGAKPGTEWSPWIVVADEHGCRIDSRRWPSTTVTDGEKLVRFTPGGSSSGTLNSDRQSLTVVTVLELFPRHTDQLRIWVYERDGSRHEFRTATRLRPPPNELTAEAVPARRTGDRLTVTLKSLTAGLDWEEIHRSSQPDLSPFQPLSWPERVVDEPHELLTWTRVTLELEGDRNALLHWAPRGVRLEDRYGNGALYRPVFRSALADGRMWLVFPSTLCRREPAWKVSLLFEYVGPESSETADLVWTHRDVAAPKARELVELLETEKQGKGITVHARGIAGPGWSEPGRGGSPYYRADLRIVTAGPGSARAAVIVKDQNGRDIQTRYNSYGAPRSERLYEFGPEVPPSAERLDLTYLVWKDRVFEFVVPPGAPAATDRFNEAKEQERVAREEFWTLTQRRLSASNDLAEKRALYEALRDRGFDLNGVDRRGATLLIWAIQDADPLRVRALLELKADINAPVFGGVTPLASAAIGGSPEMREIVKLLLGAGADPNGLPRNRPLTNAAFAGDEDVIQMLLAAGADPNAKDLRGDTALSIARYYAARAGDPVLPERRAAVIRLLMAAGAKE
ncbi:MAG: ankyrin repeat domain-containing protein [Armatimonadota bacterium]